MAKTSATTASGRGEKSLKTCGLCRSVNAMTEMMGVSAQTCLCSEGGR